MSLRHLASAIVLALPAASFAEEFDLKASIERGRPLYMQTCIACHQPTGMGIPGAFPPLSGSEYVNGSVRRMLSILLKGFQGPLTVKGMVYNNVMIPLDTQFPIYKDDAKLADVVNFVRNSFGNTNSDPATPALLGQLRAKLASRATPWTEAEVKDWKDEEPAK
jgi:mono/diheme cytochrome c family protein